MNILITGASGMTGTAVMSALEGRGHHVTGMASNEASGKALLNKGADAYVVADFQDQGSLEHAMEGQDALYHIAPAMHLDEEEIGKRTIAAAKSAHISLFGYHSVIRAPKPQIAFHWAKLQVEIALVDSGLRHFIMQPTNYMDNMTWTWELIEEAGEYKLPYSGEVRSTWVSCAEVGEAVANALTDSRFHYGTFELSGPDGPISRSEVCRYLSEAMGREVIATVEDVDAYLARPWIVKRLPKPEERARLRTMFTDYDEKGFESGSGMTLEACLGRPPTSYRDFILNYVKNK